MDRSADLITRIRHDRPPSSSRSGWHGRRRCGTCAWPWRRSGTSSSLLLPLPLSRRRRRGGSCSGARCARGRSCAPSTSGSARRWPASSGRSTTGACLDVFGRGCVWCLGLWEVVRVWAIDLIWQHDADCYVRVYRVRERFLEAVERERLTFHVNKHALPSQVRTNSLTAPQSIPTLHPPTNTTKTKHNDKNRCATPWASCGGTTRGSHSRSSGAASAPSPSRPPRCSPSRASPTYVSFR